MRNGAYTGQREDGWRAEDKLSFRQQSKMCVGGKTHFCCERTVDKGSDRQVWRWRTRDGPQEITWEEEGKMTGERKRGE